MGALAQMPVVWTAEDDLRLKNSVEDGASLESLAKGAVQFSRRFTLQEIKERWVSILYDPVISAEVSARVIEIERNSSNIPQKSFRCGGLKDNKCNAKKIKTESIRGHYYAARKRIRYDNLRSMEMELADGLIYASDHNYGMEPPLNCIIGDPNRNLLELQQSDAGLMDPCFPQFKADGLATRCTGVTAQPFHSPDHQFSSEVFTAKQGDLPKENPQIFGEASLPVDCFPDEKMGMLEDVNIHDTNGVSVNPDSIFEQMNSSGNLMDGLLPGCGVSFDNLEFPSPLPEMSIWDTIEDISASTIPSNDNLATQNHSAGDILALTEGGQMLDTCMPDYASGPAEFQYPAENQDDDPRNSDSDEYLAELYDLLGDGFPVMDTNDKPSSSHDNPFYEGISSLLLNSPVDADGEKCNTMTKPSASIPSDLRQAATEGGYPVVFCLSGSSHVDEAQPFRNSDSQMSMFSVPSHSESPADKNYFVTCVLNIEDPVVPNNDDVILPHVSISVKDLLARRNHCETASNSLNRGPKNLGRTEVSSKAQICQLATGKSCNHTTVELPELANSRGSDHCIGPDISLRGASLLPDLTNGELQELDSVAQPPLSEYVEHVQESDDEIPYYSDVEEMVLEMDLGPVDQDIELKEKVSKYQSEDARKEIIRLEQTAHSYMRRAIARQGALAVIYGRNSKHYIKKSEVLLGRGTNVSHVDIDLGAEGRAQKVSRRQAVIKLEADGKFYLTNIGKQSIYKNSLEVASGQTVRLQSSNLIEIQKITLIFEDNPACVRRHLRSLQKPVKTVTPRQEPP
uniref:FHA domain-containing protein n=1 Tax=Kalanchoe fedtschenkoi TaxID=63787 RepID=A0A7N0V655_KALFE